MRCLAAVLAFLAFVAAPRAQTVEDFYRGKQLRMINEVPALAATIIVVLVVIKPF